MPITDYFFRNRLAQMIDLRHTLAVLASGMPLQEIEVSLAHLFALTSPHPANLVSGFGISNTGRPRLTLFRGKFKNLSLELKKHLKRRQAIEPIIWHLKADHRTNRCLLKGALSAVCTRLRLKFKQNRGATRLA